MEEFLLQGTMSKSETDVKYYVLGHEDGIIKIMSTV